MKSEATYRFARMTPRKVRPYARLVRGMSVATAEAQLSHMVGKAPEIIFQVLKSAIANAVHNNGADKAKLVISNITVNEGIVMKRFQPVAKGMAHPILKRTSHITVEVDDGATKERQKAAPKASAIETVTVKDFAAQETHAEVENQEISEEKRAPAPGEKDVPADERKDGKEYEVKQKMQMMQKGGDKKKSFRRKSI
ncbi:MAG: 50S ribosomal protein L22 [Acidobacteriota bacterium]